MIMIAKGLVLLAFSAVALSNPTPKAAPISVYQQNGGEEQEYQQPQHQQQYRPVPQQYKQAPLQRPLLKQQGLQPLSDQDYEMEPPQPYQFAFDVNDDENTNYQNRKEQREGNKISGSYSVVDSDGFIRTVTYTADPVEGFKAHVSREPTNIVVKIPEPKLEPLGQKVQYTSAAQPQVQYNGAPQQSAPRPVQLRPQGGVPTTPRRQQTQQYLQGSHQDPYATLQSQGSVRVSQAISQGGQVNQFLSELSPESSQINQFSNSNTGLRG